MAVTFEGNLTSGTFSMTTGAGYTIPAGGVPAGNLVVVNVGTGGYGTSSVTVADDRDAANVYTVRADTISGDPTNRGSAVAWCVLTTALQAGDTITISFSVKCSGFATVDEWSGVAATEDGIASASGSSTTPSSGAISPANATNLILGSLGYTDGGSPTEDSDSAGGDTWHTLTGGGTAGRALWPAYKITTSATSQTYDPSLGSTAEWGCGIVALKGSAAAVTMDMWSPRRVDWVRPRPHMRPSGTIKGPRIR